LVGDEGLGKSTILKKLGREWFSDSFSTVQGKEAFEQLQGVWVMEMAELAGLKKAEVEATKHFISKQEDRYRVAYGRRLENFPRQSVFFGTTNNADFLRGDTGNRRFWPVQTYVNKPILSVFNDLTDEEVGQIWAEAVQLFKAGEPLYLPKHIEDQARIKQTEHSESDERAGMVAAYLDTPLPVGWKDMGVYERRNWLADDELRATGTEVRQRVCVAEIWCELFGEQQSKMTRFLTKDIHSILKGLKGWEAPKHPSEVKIYGKQRCYERASGTSTNVAKEGNNAKVVELQSLQAIYKKN
jgi:predicted P-loop ATPase